MKQKTYHHTEIRPILFKYLSEAKTAIQLAIGEFEDESLLALFQKKIHEGVKIHLILSKQFFTKNQEARLNELINNDGQITWLIDSYKEKLIDYKFGIIDSNIVFTGNYNWRLASIRDENFLSISEGMPTFVAGFKSEFDYLCILNQLSTKHQKPDNNILKLLKKLEVLKTLLSLGDTEFIQNKLALLKEYESDANIRSIYNHLLQEEFDEALELIKTFSYHHQPLRDCIDPPFDRLQREIQYLEEEITNISNEFSETQKKLHEFSKKHSEILGDLLAEILLESKIKAAIEANQNEDKVSELDKAEKDYDEYTRSYELSKKQKIQVLNATEQKELKKLYRQSSMKCHPDRVLDEMHDKAEEIFIALNEAYNANNIERVREINQQLKSGIILSKSGGITELKKLESTLNNLTLKLEDWERKLDTLKQMPTYKTISHIADWDTYFEETKTVLVQQLERLKVFNQEQNKV